MTDTMEMEDAGDDMDLDLNGVLQQSASHGAAIKQLLLHFRPSARAGVALVA